jgi:hypothetical protein
VAADLIRYVNASSSGGDGKTNAESGASAAYSSFFAWEAAEDNIGDSNLPANQTIHRVYFDSGTGDTGDTTAVTIAGFTSDADYYLSFEANTNGQGSKDNSATSVWDSTKYNIVVSGAGPQTVNNSGGQWAKFTGLQIGAIGTNASAGGKAIFIQTGSGPTWLINCIIRYQHNHATNGNSSNFGYPVWSNGLMEAVNSIAYIENLAAGAPYNSIAWYLQSPNDNNRCINCTGVAAVPSQNISIGFWNVGNGNPDPIAVNCLGYGSDSTISGGFWEAGTNWDSKCSNNASNGTYAPGSGSTTGVTFSFVSFAGFNFTLTADDTGAQSLGTDMSSDSTSGSYLSSDFLGTTRTDPWDIGYHQVAAAAPSGGGGAGTLTDPISVGIFGVSAFTVGPINTYA